MITATVLGKISLGLLHWLCEGVCVFLFLSLAVTRSIFVAITCQNEHERRISCAETCKSIEKATAIVSHSLSTRRDETIQSESCLTNELLRWIGETKKENRIADVWDGKGSSWCALLRLRKTQSSRWIRVGERDLLLLSSCVRKVILTLAEQLCHRDINGHLSPRRSKHEPFEIYTSHWWDALTVRAHF